MQQKDNSLLEKNIHATKKITWDKRIFDRE